MRSIAVFVMIFVAAYSTQAQTFTRNNVTDISLRSSGTIMQNEQVKGYFSFYNLERKDNKTNNYQLSIFDENLHEINSINITKPKTYTILDGTFNGSAFCFLFYDYKKKVTELISYDSTLRQLGFSLAPVTNKFSKAEYGLIAQGNVASQNYLVPIPGKGFVKYGLQSKGYAYLIEFFDNNMKKQWSKVSTVGSKFEIASEAFLEDDYLGSTIVTKQSKGSKNIETSLLVQRVTDGSEVFRVPLVTDLYSLSFSKVYFDKENQQFVVFGEYYNKNDKELKAQSLGFTALTLDLTGKILSQKLNSWTDISKVAPINKDGKFEGSNIRIVLHDVVRTSDGQFFVIGEQYEKVLSGAGIAAQGASLALAMLTGVYTSTASSVQLNIYNMVVLQFNPDFTIHRIHLFEKNKTAVYLPAGAGFTSSKQLSFYAKFVGGFDYAYTQNSIDKNSFSIAYIDYDKGKGKGQKPSNILGSIIFTPEKVFSVDKMKLNRESSFYHIYKAKDGYVMVTEYFKTEKRVESRLEKLNY